MVILVQVVRSLAALLQAEEGVQPLIERLDPPRRAAVLMAILALVLTGIVLVACVMIGGRWVRRLGGDDLRRTPTDKQAREPWRDAILDALPNTKTGDTVHIDKKSGETRTD